MMTRKHQFSDEEMGRKLKLSPYFLGWQCDFHILLVIIMKEVAHGSKNPYG